MRVHAHLYLLLDMRVLFLQDLHQYIGYMYLTCAHVVLNLFNELRKRGKKYEACRADYLFFATKFNKTNNIYMNTNVR